MKWRFWKKEKVEAETILQISAGNAGIQTLYVKTNDASKALKLIQKLKKLVNE